jgi:L-2-hydroxyglutarate oxidase LhgO
MDSVECVVIGAGVVGLAVARALALDGRETIVVEAERLIGSGISSRNSEVIHGGIYYPPGSFKARFCVEGRRQLYAYCETHAVPYRRCGKLIVATTEPQISELGLLDARARSCGVDDLRLLSGTEARRLEPALNALAALESPSTGIIDSQAYMLSLQGEAEANGAVVAFNTRVTGLDVGRNGMRLRVQNETDPSLAARMVVNAAGLNAQSIARLVEDLPQDRIPPLYYAKGNYFGLTGRSPFTRLIYPAPEAGGLGTHLTLDLGGHARFGPDVEWIAEPDFTVDPRRSKRFYDSIRAYWPKLPDGALSPDYAGIRPKLSGPGEPPADFVISGPDDHGVAGLINLFGIESPGLTASLAIGGHVAQLAANAFDRRA